MFSAIQPLYSLTQDPRKYKFKQPPQITDFDEIVEFYLDRLSQENVIDDVLHLLEVGLPLENLVKFVVRSVVLEGIHTIENGFLVRPIIFEYLKGIANKAGIEYKEAFSNKKESEDKMLGRAAQLAKKGLKGRERDAGVELILSAIEEPEEGMQAEEEMMVEEEQPQEPDQMEMDLGEEEEQQRPSGLMARG